MDQTDSPLSEEEDVISDLQNNITEIRGEIRRSPVAEDGQMRSQSFTHLVFFKTTSQKFLCCLVLQMKAVLVLPLKVHGCRPIRAELPEKPKIR